MFKIYLINIIFSLIIFLFAKVKKKRRILYWIYNNDLSTLFRERILYYEYLL